MTRWKVALVMAYVAAAPVFVVAGVLSLAVGFVHVPFAMFFHKHSCPLCRWAARQGVSMRLEDRDTCKCHVIVAEASDES